MTWLPRLIVVPSGLLDGAPVMVGVGATFVTVMVWLSVVKP